MNKVTSSRTAEIDINKCIEKHGGNKYAMIVERSKRARVLAKENLRQDHYVNATVTSLLELQDKK